LDRRQHDPRTKTVEAAALPAQVRLGDLAPDMVRLDAETTLARARPGFAGGPCRRF